MAGVVIKINCHIFCISENKQINNSQISLSKVVLTVRCTIVYEPLKKVTFFFSICLPLCFVFPRVCDPLDCELIFIIESPY